jgi:NADPH:quinone reductase-like Zn-dependent oxidoreductase
VQAIVYHRYGPPDVLEYREIERPCPARGEVLIQVHAASVNPYDWHFLRGTPSLIRLLTGLRRPKSSRLGADVAGVVAMIGPAVTRFAPGDAVFGVCKGAFAEFACGKETELVRKPEHLGFEQAASIPIAGITALQGVRDSGRVQPGQRLLINGASGGVGTFAVQIGKWLGAHVTGVCSTRNVALVESLGADSVIDYTARDFTRSNAVYDVIFDLVGNRPLSVLRLALDRKGTFVGCGGGGPEKSTGDLLAMMLGRLVVAPFASQRLTGVLAKINPADLNILSELVRSGRIRPILDRSYLLSETAAALRQVEGGHARGKVTIRVR